MSDWYYLAACFHLKLLRSCFANISNLKLILFFFNWNNNSTNEASQKEFCKGFFTKRYKNTRYKNLRIRQVLENVTEWLPVRTVQKSAKCPDEAEQVKPLDVQLSADLVVVGQHRAKEAQAGLKHPHQRQGQAGPERGQNYGSN